MIELPPLYAQNVQKFPYPKPWDSLPWKWFSSPNLGHLSPPVDTWVWAYNGFQEIFPAILDSSGDWHFAEGAVFEGGFLFKMIWPVAWLPLENLPPEDIATPDEEIEFDLIEREKS